MSESTKIAEFAHGHFHSAEQAVAELQIQKGHIVLDLGCGDGHHSVAIEKRRPGVIINVDICKESLEILAESDRRRNEVIQNMTRRYVCSDALDLPFVDDTFDRALCSLIFYLLPLRRAMAELCRVLKPAGKAYVRVPMLAWGRVYDALTGFPQIRTSVYQSMQVVNGVFFLLTGRQMHNILMRRDKWACYVPRARFEETALSTGFKIEKLSIDYPRNRIPSIDAWLRKE